MGKLRIISVIKVSSENYRIYTVASYFKQGVKSKAVILAPYGKE
jgi:hypothetical protein